MRNAITLTMAAAAMAVTAMLLPFMAGCQGTAHMAIQSADSLGQVADELETAVKEYHDETNTFDDSRERAVAAAFVARVKKDPDKTEQNTAAFIESLQNIRRDRDTENERKMACLNNISALREVAKGLNRVGVDSMNLSDEARRYFSSWADGYQKYRQQKLEQAAANRAARKAKQDALMQDGLSLLGSYLTKKPGTGGTNSVQ